MLGECYAPIFNAGPPPQRATWLRRTWDPKPPAGPVLNGDKTKTALSSPKALKDLGDPRGPGAVDG